MRLSVAYKQKAQKQNDNFERAFDLLPNIKIRAHKQNQRALKKTEQ